MSPYSDASAPAPYIYDKFGNLVWDGYGAVGAANAHNFHVCSYQGVDHLCMMVGNQQEGSLTLVDSDVACKKRLTTHRLRIRHRHHRRQRLPHRRLSAIGRQHDARGHARIHAGGGRRDGSHHGVQHHSRRSLLPALQCHRTAGLAESGRLSGNQHHYRTGSFRVVLFQSCGYSRYEDSAAFD